MGRPLKGEDPIGDVTLAFIRKNEHNIGKFFYLTGRIAALEFEINTAKAEHEKLLNELVNAYVDARVKGLGQVS